MKSKLSGDCSKLEKVIWTYTSADLHYGLAKIYANHSGNRSGDLPEKIAEEVILLMQEALAKERLP